MFYVIFKPYGLRNICTLVKTFILRTFIMCRLGECADLPKPPIKKGPQGGKYQPAPRTKQKKRYLLEDKKVQTGPQGGKYQEYRDKKGHKERRYLLHKK